MLMRRMVAALHLLALDVGLGAVWVRGATLRPPLDVASLRRVSSADALWGGAAGLWVATGLRLAFAGLEQGSAYDLHNRAFWVNMGLLTCILRLEV